jgi:hypothetical protein
VVDIDPVLTEEDTDTLLGASVLFVVRSLAHNDSDPAGVEGFVVSVVDTPDNSHEVTGLELVFSLQHPTSMLAI